MALNQRIDLLTGKPSRPDRGHIEQGHPRNCVCGHRHEKWVASDGEAHDDLARRRCAWCPCEQFEAAK